MKKLPILWAIFLVFIFSSSAQTVQEDKSRQAETLYQKAVDLILKNFSSPSLLKAIEILEQASQLDPGNDRIWSKLSSLYWHYGDRLPKKKKEERQIRLQWFEKGMEAGEKAMKLNPDNVEALFYYTTNLASSGEMKGILNSLWMFPTLCDNMEKVDKMDPNFEQGSVDRFWSEVLVRVPNFVAKMFGSSKQDGIADLKEDIKKWPNHFASYTYLARLLWSIKKKDEALKYLEYILTHNPNADPEWASENRYEQEVARKQWKQWTGKDFPNR